MQICPNCARELEERDIICVFCGHTRSAGGEAPPPPVVIVEKPTAELVVVARRAPAKLKTVSRNAILASTAIGAIAGVMFDWLARASHAPADASGLTVSPVDAT